MKLQKCGKNSLKQARDIDMNLVDAQQARRVLDRMVGYKISPIYGQNKRGLSAGRVQSVALRLICDRENEINAFIPEEYWTLDVALEPKGSKKGFIARYAGELKNQEQLQALMQKLEHAQFKVTERKDGTRNVKAPNPFTTSTLQQDASRKLNFSTQKRCAWHSSCMKVLISKDGGR